MMIDHKFTLTGLFVVAAFVQPAGAVDTQVHFSGCVAPGVEHGCLVVRTGRDVYNITGAKPQPDYKRGLGISGSGIKTNKMSYCMQGPVLDDIKWHFTRQSCPVPHRATMAKRKR